MIFIKYRLWLTSVAKYCKSFNFDSLSSKLFQNLICGNYTPSTPIPTQNSTPIPTHAAQESATVDFVNTGSTNLTTHTYPLSIRVVDHLSLAAIADSIMVEVEDLNHYGVGLFDFASEALVFSLALRLARNGQGKGVPPFAIPHFLNSAIWDYQNL